DTIAPGVGDVKTIPAGQRLILSDGHVGCCQPCAPGLQSAYLQRWVPLAARLEVRRYADVYLLRAARKPRPAASLKVGGLFKFWQPQQIAKKRPRRRLASSGRFNLHMVQANDGTGFLGHYNVRLSLCPSGRGSKGAVPRESIAATSAN